MIDFYSPDNFIGSIKGCLHIVLIIALNSGGKMIVLVEVELPDGILKFCC